LIKRFINNSPWATRERRSPRSSRKGSMPRSRRPRIADVAKLAKVSPAVVSMVINNRTDSTVRTGPETVKRVWAAISELGYVPNPVAQSLASGRNRILGVFTHEALFPVDQRSFYHPFLVGIEEEAEEQGYDMMLFTSTRHSDGTRRIYRDGVNRLQVADGAVLLGWAENREEIERLAAEGFPFTYVGRREIGDAAISYAAADYPGATAEVVEHLVELGHRRILYLSFQPEQEASVDRRRGFREAHQRLGLAIDEDFCLSIKPSEISLGLLESWLAAGYSALVVENDILAEPLLRLAESAGMRVPESFSLAVLGDPLVYTEDTPNWTTYRLPRIEMGRHAARLLIAMLSAPQPQPPRHVVLPCTFVPGATSAPPR
jgi:DNA-binding LacI/PurR family transcriptional regulator